jgi:uncharacterized glyoxalase superfamily protein PhnB
MISQINLVVRDMEATVAFYRRLVLDVQPHPAAAHLEVHFANGLSLEFDTVDAVSMWDSGFAGARAGAVVLGIALASRDAVDESFAELAAAGGTEHQRSYDALWGGRYAMIEDPDGYCLGLMSPIDDARKVWPPEAPPAGA